MEKEINSLTDFTNYLKDINITSYYYRGENNKHPAIASSLLRRKNNIHKYENLVNDFFSEVVNRVNDQIKQNFIPFCQHHGLYTNLIDITESPYVALYFSCVGYKNDCGYIYMFSKNLTVDMSDVIKNRLFAPAPCYNVMQYRERDKYVSDSTWNVFFQKLISESHNIRDNPYQEEMKRSLMLLAGDEGPFAMYRGGMTKDNYDEYEKYFDRMVMSDMKYTFPILPYCILKPDNVFDRIRNQNGLFIYQLFVSHPSPTKPDVVDTYIQEIKPQQQLIINNQESILKELDYMGINEKYIFGDYENIAKHINRRHFVE